MTNSETAGEQNKAMSRPVVGVLLDGNSVGDWRLSLEGVDFVSGQYGVGGGVASVDSLAGCEAVAVDVDDGRGAVVSSFVTENLFVIILVDVGLLVIGTLIE